MANDIIFEAKYKLNNHEGKIVFAFYGDDDASKNNINTPILLSTDEKENFNRLKTVEAQNSFILGKLCGKLAVSKFCNISKFGIAIHHGVFGQPIVESNSKNVKISISHINNTAFAMAFHEETLCGCDIELVQKNNINTISQVLTEKEKKICTPNTELISYHILWSAKESLAKAINLGFLINMDLLEVKQIERKSGYYQVAFKNFAMFTGIAIIVNSKIITFVFPNKLMIDSIFFQSLKEKLDISPIF